MKYFTYLASHNAPANRLQRHALKLLIDRSNLTDRALAQSSFDRIIIDASSIFKNQGWFELPSGSWICPEHAPGITKEAA